MRPTKYSPIVRNKHQAGGGNSRYGKEHTMKMHSLKDLLEHEVRDLLSAEKQLVSALPKMAKAASEPKLREAFESHLAETKGQIERLEKICGELGISARAEKCEAMAGLIEEGSEAIEAKGEDAVRDAALIASAQRVEHYEMAAYGCARAYAKQLGLNSIVKILTETFDEESSADTKLNDLAESIVNPRAAELVGAA
tara:strand:- start:88 stop:678 length:591 start_codon:yes stop_codon:yes gene_type:complete